MSVQEERARLLRAHLTGNQGKAVVTTWVGFALHANGCSGECGVVAVRCRKPGLQSNVFPPMLRELCPDGRVLFESWRFAVDELRTLHLRETEQEEMPA